jgi:folate-dependent phosphoribosylglycinamide formyltransferase PurN
MKILFIFRDSYDSQYILSKLGKYNIESRVIIETGSKARKKKLVKAFSKIPFYKYPLKVIDLVALIFYSSVAIKLMKKKLGNFRYPKQQYIQTIEDVNDGQCVQHINEYKPDLIFVYGTAILSKKLLQTIKFPIFNIHSGILPYYRNVHSDFWSFVNKDFNNIGISIIYLDAGIDSGDIVLQKKIIYNSNDSLVDIKTKNLSLIPDLVIELISLYKSKKLKRVKQNKKFAGFYHTPGFIDLTRLLNKKRYV